jgi:hypothetical protein
MTTFAEEMIAGKQFPSGNQMMPGLPTAQGQQFPFFQQQMGAQVRPQQQIGAQVMPQDWEQPMGVPQPQQGQFQGQFQGPFGGFPSFNGFPPMMQQPPMMPPMGFAPFAPFQGFNRPPFPQQGGFNFNQPRPPFFNPFNSWTTAQPVMETTTTYYYPTAEAETTTTEAATEIPETTEAITEVFTDGPAY